MYVYTSSTSAYSAALGVPTLAAASSGLCVAIVMHEAMMTARMKKSNGGHVTSRWHVCRSRPQQPVAPTESCVRSSGCSGSSFSPLDGGTGSGWAVALDSAACSPATPRGRDASAFELRPPLPFDFRRR